VQGGGGVVADPDVEFGGFEDPIVFSGGPVVALFAADGEGDLLFLAGLQSDAAEAFQLADGPRGGAVALMEVELDNFIGGF